MALDSSQQWYVLDVFNGGNCTVPVGDPVLIL